MLHLQPMELGEKDKDDKRVGWSPYVLFKMPKTWAVTSFVKLGLLPCSPYFGLWTLTCCHWAWAGPDSYNLDPMVDCPLTRGSHENVGFVFPVEYFLLPTLTKKKKYFLLPYSALRSDISPLDLASIARKLTSEAAKSSRKQSPSVPQSPMTYSSSMSGQFFPSPMWSSSSSPGRSPGRFVE
ncbi:hypothetical protein FF1_020893 [Malus domestica]|uniref:Uncharacterized protein n=1 Tax=Malus domestica TaxID=3750 RepID=A0A498HM89_MALDO|nr:hypothetical protein DVH24_007299 [Malus domestica]